MANKKTISTVLTILAALGAVTYLLISGFDDTVVYYKTVDELMAAPERFAARPVRINGRLVPHSVQVKPGTNQYRFSIEKRKKTLTVAYEGILPDTMSEGQDLVVQGTFDTGKRVFVANEVLTKCPSKYEKKAAAIN